MTRLRLAASFGVLALAALTAVAAHGHARATVCCTGINPAPSINVLTPDSALVNASITGLTITGSNLYSNATAVTWTPAGANATSVVYDSSMFTVTEDPNTLIDTLTMNVAIPAGGAFGTASVTVTSANGTSNPLYLYVNQTGTQAVGVDAATVDTSGTTQVATCNTVGPFSSVGNCVNARVAADSGTAVAVAVYNGDPVTAAPPAGVNAFYDVYVAAPAGGSVQSVTIINCDGPDNTAYYYNGTAWQPVTPVTPPGFTTDTSGCLEYELTIASTPSVLQLAGTPFAAGIAPPTTTATTAPARLVHPDATLSLTSVVVSTTVNGKPAQASLGPATCWSSDGVAVTLKATAALGSPAVQQITYTTTDGKRTFAPVNVLGTTAQFTVDGAGLTVVQYYATDVKGDREAAKALSVLVLSGRNDMPEMACTFNRAITLPTPKSGTVHVQGTLSVKGAGGTTVTRPIDVTVPL